MARLTCGFERGDPNVKYEHLTKDQEDAILDTHIQQVEQQHASALIQVEREKAGGRDAAPHEQLVAQLEKEHALLVKMRKAK